MNSTKDLNEQSLLYTEKRTGHYFRMTIIVSASQLTKKEPEIKVEA